MTKTQRRCLLWSTLLVSLCVWGVQPSVAGGFGQHFPAIEQKVAQFFAGRVAVTTPSDNEVLTYSSSTGAWTAEATGTPPAIDLLDGTLHGDTAAGTVVRGDVITGQSATAKWTRLAKGTANQVLSMDGTATDVAWTTLAAATWESSLTAGNTSGANDPTISTGQSLLGAAELTMDSTGTNAVNLGTAAAAKTITVGNAASTEVQVDGLLLDFNGASVDIDATTDSGFTVTGSGQDLVFNALGGGSQRAILQSQGTGSTAIIINALSGGLDMDAVITSALTVTGSGQNLNLQALGGGAQQLNFTSAGTGVDAINLNATAGGVQLNADGNSTWTLFDFAVTQDETQAAGTAGNPFAWTTGAGAPGSGATAGAAGGPWASTAGVGGVGTATPADGGIGGAATVTSGVGGASGGAGSTAGAGGDVLIVAAAAGATGAGTAGNQGRVAVTSGTTQYFFTAAGTAAGPALSTTATTIIEAINEADATANAGSDHGVATDNVEIGPSSDSGAGARNTVLGDTAVVAGGDDCVVIGQGASTADASDDQVIIGAGANSSASDTGSIVIGRNASTDASLAIVIGRNASNNTSASGDVVIGDTATSPGGGNNVVIGQNSSAAISTGTAVGFNADVTTGGVALGANANTTAGNNSIAIGSSATTTASNQMVVGSNTQAPIAQVVLGSGVADTTAIAQLLLTTTNGSGTDNHAADLVLQSGLSTGAGAVTDMLFKTPDVLGSGTTTQTAVTRLTLNETISTFTTALNVDAAITADTTLAVTGVATFTATADFDGGLRSRPDRQLRVTLSLPSLQARERMTPS